jgi:hypothetical protein
MSQASNFNGDYWASSYFDDGYWGTGAAITVWRGPGRRHRRGAKDFRKAGPEPDFADQAYWKSVAERRRLAEQVRKAKDVGDSERLRVSAQMAAIGPQQEDEDVEYLLKQADEEERGMIARVLQMIIGIRK